MICAYYDVILSHDLHDWSECMILRKQKARSTVLVFHHSSSPFHYLYTPIKYELQRLSRFWDIPSVYHTWCTTAVHNSGVGTRGAGGAVTPPLFHSANILRRDSRVKLPCCLDETPYTIKKTEALTPKHVPRATTAIHINFDSIF